MFAPLLQEINIVTSCQFLSNLDISNLTALHTLLASDGASNDYTFTSEFTEYKCTKLYRSYDFGNMGKQRFKEFKFKKLFKPAIS